METIINVEKEKELTVIKPSGRLDVSGSDIFEKTSDKLINEGARLFLIDCSQVEFLSSSGLRVLLILHNKLENTGGKMLICCPNERVMDVFNLSRFDKVIRIVPTKEEAKKLF
jgi:anti-sigma B factor antagonist